MIVNVEVKNLPEEVNRAYLVVRVVDAELWYYGAYYEKTLANKVAIEIGNGLVLEVNK